MFLNITGFKRLLKAAYKGSGLVAGEINQSLVLMNAAGTWGVQVGNEYVPKKLKGALAELIGGLPEQGEVYTYRPEEMQAEIDLGRFDFFERWKRAADFAVQTPFIIRSSWDEYVLMQLKGTMRLRPIGREFVDLICEKDLDHKTESMPGRPGYEDGILYWKNDTMIYWAGTSNLSKDMEGLVVSRLDFLDCFGKEPALRQYPVLHEGEV